MLLVKYSDFVLKTRQVALVFSCLLLGFSSVGQEGERSPLIVTTGIDSVTYFLPKSTAYKIESRSGLGGITIADLSNGTTDTWIRDIYSYSDEGEIAYIHRKAKSGVDVYLYGRQLEFGVNHKEQNILNRAEVTDTVEVTVYNFSKEPLTFSVADNILDFFCCIEGSITLPPQSDSSLVLTFSVNPGRYVRELYFFGKNFVAIEEVFSGGYHLTTDDFNHPERRINVPTSFYYYHTNKATTLEVRDPINHELILTFDLHKPWTKVTLKDMVYDRVFLTLAPEALPGSGTQQQALMVDFAD